MGNCERKEYDDKVISHRNNLWYLYRSMADDRELSYTENEKMKMDKGDNVYECEEKI